MVAISLPTTVGTGEMLSKRLLGGGYGSGYYNGGYSRWSGWGRWALLGGIIFVFLLFFILCSCLTARRRRKRGAQPMYGTGWMAGNHGAVNYYGNNNQNAAPATGQYATNGNQGYYSGYNNNDAAPPYSTGQPGYYTQPTELQQPGNTYQPQRGGDGVYAPPAGPPPGKEIIR